MTKLNCIFQYSCDHPSFRYYFHSVFCLYPIFGNYFFIDAKFLSSEHSVEVVEQNIGGQIWIIRWLGIILTFLFLFDHEFTRHPFCTELINAQILMHDMSNTFIGYFRVSAISL